MRAPGGFGRLRRHVRELPFRGRSRRARRVREPPRGAPRRCDRGAAQRGAHLARAPRGVRAGRRARRGRLRREAARSALAARARSRLHRARRRARPGAAPRRRARALGPLLRGRDRAPRRRASPGRGASGERFRDPEHLYADDLDLFGAAVSSSCCAARARPRARRCWRPGCSRPRRATRCAPARRPSPSCGRRSTCARRSRSSAKRSPPACTPRRSSAGASRRRRRRLRRCARSSRRSSPLSAALIVATLAGAPLLIPWLAVLGLGGVVAAAVARPRAPHARRDGSPRARARAARAAARRARGPALRGAAPGRAAPGDRHRAAFPRRGRSRACDGSSICSTRAATSSSRRSARRFSSPRRSRSRSTPGARAAGRRCAPGSTRPPSWRRSRRSRPTPTSTRTTSSRSSPTGRRASRPRRSAIRCSRTSRCVRNDVRLGDAPRLLLVSGSNMSGKSTLLRSVGVAARARAGRRAGARAAAAAVAARGRRVAAHLRLAAGGPLALLRRDPPAARRSSS